MLKILLPIALILLLPPLTPGGAHAQAPVDSDSLEYASFVEKLLPFFPERKVRTIISKLPANSKIFGYDIGEMSGDGSVDVVLSARSPLAPGNVLGIYFFLNAGSHFELVSTLSRRYMVEPIEIGFTIEEGVCHVTEKRGEFSWDIVGYAVRDSVFRRVRYWETRRVLHRDRETAVGVDRGVNLEDMATRVQYFGGNTGRHFLRQEYYSLPLYAASDWVHPSLPSIVGDSTAFAVLSGPSSWFGYDDCSIFASGSYDDSSVTIDVTMHDDIILSAQADSASDYAELALDFSRTHAIGPGGAVRSPLPSEQLTVRMFPPSATSGFRVEYPAPANRELREQVRVRIRQMPEHSFAFVCSVELPLEQFQGPREHPVKLAVTYHDVDREERPEWVTVVSTSRHYQPGLPVSYGTCELIEHAGSWCEVDDLRTRRLARLLEHAGVAR